jgi:cyclopropane-fatty-acyl-phospholipid synthase
MDPIALATALFRGPSRSFPVRLWTGVVLPPAQGAPGVRGTVVLSRPEAVEAFVLPTERALAEAILSGAIELEGDVVGVLVAASRWEGPARGALAGALVQRAARRLSAGRSGAGPGESEPASRLRDAEPVAVPVAARLRGWVHSVARDRAAVRHHYDVSDDFYRLFLDRRLVYSCGCFAEEDDALEEAQARKLELVCRKLALARGERLLDVGCGWGALVEHAIAAHGADVVGITLSEHQLTEARRRLEALGASERSAVLAVDYRRLPRGEAFDKIASVGMMEHVGRDRLPGYFRALFRLLRPGGLLLNHAIADVSPRGPTLAWASRRGGGFITSHIFPDSDLVPLPIVLRAAERAGFEVRDVESLREHYDQTLIAWLGRLEARWDEAVRLVGPRRARAYRLYLASSAASFRLGRISVFQTLLARRTTAGRAEGAPRWRTTWYEAAPGRVRERDVGVGAGAS